MEVHEITELVGQNIVNVARRDLHGLEALELTAEDGRVFRFHHLQDCCESVSIEDVCGDLYDLIGVIVEATESVKAEPEHDYGVGAWTFYRFSTSKGTVTVRWYGESNGYYSVGVDLTIIEPGSEG